MVLYHYLANIRGEYIIYVIMNPVYKGPLSIPGDYHPFSDVDGDVLKVMQSVVIDELAVDALHESTEKIYPVYKFGHVALESLAVNSRYDDFERIAFTRGVTLYEITRGFVDPWAPKYSLPAVVEEIAKFHDLSDTPEKQEEVFRRAVDELQTQQGNFTQFIEDSADIYDPFYVIQGAAAARAVEVNIINAAIHDSQLPPNLTT